MQEGKPQREFADMRPQRRVFEYPRDKKSIPAGLYEAAAGQFGFQEKPIELQGAFLTQFTAENAKSGYFNFLEHDGRWWKVRTYAPAYFNSEERPQELHNGKIVFTEMSPKEIEEERAHLAKERESVREHNRQQTPAAKRQVIVKARLAEEERNEKQREEDQRRREEQLTPEYQAQLKQQNEADAQRWKVEWETTLYKYRSIRLRVKFKRSGNEEEKEFLIVAPKNESCTVLPPDAQWEFDEKVGAGCHFSIGERRLTPEELAQMKHVRRVGDVLELDLTRMPVINCRGQSPKRGGEQTPYEQMVEFKKQNPTFQGAFILHRWESGHRTSVAVRYPEIIIPSAESLDPKKRISGKRPERQFIDPRWDQDGRWIATEAEVLHGRTTRVVREGVEREPGPEKIVEELTKEYGTPAFEHPLYRHLKSLIEDVRTLELRRVLYKPGETRKVREMVAHALLEKFKKFGVRRVSNIPKDFSLTVDDVDHDLATNRDTLGVFDIPGLGRRTVSSYDSSFDRLHGPIIRLTPEEFQKITSWPFNDVGIEIEGVRGDVNASSIFLRLSNVFGHERPDLNVIKELFNELWIDQEAEKLRQRVMEKVEADKLAQETKKIVNPLTGKEMTFTARVEYGGPRDRQYYVVWKAQKNE